MNNKVKSEQKLNLKKNQEISLTIEDFTKEGEGLGKYQGFPFFVKDTVIGDEVRVSITKLKKNYGYARLVEIVTPSKDRVTPPCPVFLSLTSLQEKLILLYWCGGLLLKWLQLLIRVF